MTAGPVAILAASGELPALIADSLATAGRPFRLLAVKGFSDRALRARADAAVDLFDVQGYFAHLEAWRPAAVTLAGGLKRPSPDALAGAFSAFRNRDEIRAIVTRGDDNLLRGVIGVLEDRGYPVVGVRDLAPELLAGGGPYGRRHPGPRDEVAIARGLHVLDAMSPFDIGQAVVVADERVLAIEGPEGTDQTLSRIRALRAGRIPWRRSRMGGVLVKAPKRGQDLRVDLPAIGPRTVVNAAAAGLDGIAIARGATLVLQRAETVAAADRLGLFVVGIEAACFPSGEEASGG